MSKHTPGPWSGWYRIATSSADSPSCGRVDGPPWTATKEICGYTNPADVALIAAAPELLHAMKLVLADHDERILSYPDKENQPNRLRVMGIARLAIAKAESVT